MAIKNVKQVFINSDGDVWLIASKKKRAKVGYYDKDNRALFLNKDPRKHLFKKMDAYGVNFELLQCPLFNTIVIYQKGIPGHLWTYRESFLEKGAALHFKESGYELQLFLPREQFYVVSRPSFIR